MVQSLGSFNLLLFFFLKHMERVVLDLALIYTDP